MKRPFFLCLLGLVFACGSDDDDDGRFLEAQDLGEEGVYEVRLSPLSPQVNPLAEGMASITVNATGEMFLHLEVKDVDPGIKHKQFIYSGGACPTAALDFNTDGYIDQTEMVDRTQAPLIPLDQDLGDSSQGPIFPRASAGGNYVYEVRGNVPQGLNLERRIIIVHGVAGFDVLPETVGERGELDPEENFPVLCGEIRRIQ